MLIKQLTINTTSIASELIADILQDYSEQGVSIYDKNDLLNLIQTYQFWDYINEDELQKSETVKVCAFFDEDKYEACLIEIKNRLEELKKMSEFNLGSLEMSTQDVESEDWYNSWKKSYRPIKEGKIVIVPSWIKYEKNEDEKIVLMDPGMAFGSGEHETTRMCLKLMESLGVKDKSVIDVGTGSGILALAACALGCLDVEAYDIDDVAVKAARENVKMNHMQDKIKVDNSNLLQKASKKYDIVLANITADVLKILSSDLKKYVKKDGIIIISGILNIYEDDVKNTYENQGYTIIDRINMGEWVAFKLNI